MIVKVGGATAVISTRGTSIVLTTHSGYRATFPACGREECRDGTVEPCPIRPSEKPPWRHTLPKVYGRPARVADWEQHCRECCHGWHTESVEAVARRVLATYGGFAEDAKKRLEKW